jgi:tripartite-type tricarboxylate transporter receptor subunit TctC
VLCSFLLICFFLKEFFMVSLDLKKIFTALALTSSVMAYAFPEKTVTIVVPTAAGGGNDAMARVIAQKMGPLLGQSVIVENKAGANGSIATEFVARASPDGHTVLFGYVADFEPVGLVGYSPTLMVVTPQLKAADAKTVLASIQAQDGKLSYASAGNGTAPHFAAELYKLNMKASWMHVPYKGSAPAVNDTVAGHTQIMFPSLFTALPHVKSGKLHPVGIAGSRRSPALPGVPTLKELGVPGVDVTQWYALFVPAKTPKAVVDRLNAALNQVLTDKDTVARIEAQGADVQTSTPEELKAMVRDDLTKWRRVVQQAKLSAD